MQFVAHNVAKVQLDCTVQLLHRESRNPWRLPKYFKNHGVFFHVTHNEIAFWYELQSPAAVRVRFLSI